MAWAVTLRPFCYLALLLLAGLIAPAQAGAPTCAVSTPGVAFGNYNPTSTTAETTIGSGNLLCTYTGTGFTATITLSTGNSGTYANRTMTLGSQNLRYNLYLDTGYTMIFGNGASGTYDITVCYPGGTVTCTGATGQSGVTYSGTVYGLLPAGQNVTAGTFTDTLVVTVTY
jgi:spore coat protein U-like protein